MLFKKEFWHKNGLTKELLTGSRAAPEPEHLTTGLRLWGQLEEMA